MGQPWVQAERLLLLLDGLDEVASAHRATCVAAINQFRQDYGTTEIVVCSRIGDYEQLATQLQFQAAVLIQSLDPEQVNDYLAQVGSALAGVQEVLTQAPELQALASKPLFLSILSLAYQDVSAVELLDKPEVERLQLLFERYIQQMFH